MFYCRRFGFGRRIRILPVFCLFSPPCFYFPSLPHSQQKKVTRVSIVPKSWFDMMYPQYDTCAPSSTEHLFNLKRRLKGTKKGWITSSTSAQTETGIGSDGANIQHISDTTHLWSSATCNHLSSCLCNCSPTHIHLTTLTLPSLNHVALVVTWLPTANRYNYNNSFEHVSTEQRWSSWLWRGLNTAEVPGSIPGLCTLFCSSVVLPLRLL